MKRVSFRTAGLLVCCVWLLLAGVLPVRAAAPQVPATLSGPQLSLLPYLEAFIDTTGEMDVEEVAAPANAPAFQPLDVKKLPRVTGSTWLRFTLAPAAAGAENTAILLDMSESIPGRAALFTPGVDSLSGTTQWQEATPGSRKVLLLPRSGAEAQTCYIRLDGLPGIWFAPMLRTPHNAATDISSLAPKSALLALGVVMLLCLLRGLSEPGQWRFWTALYVGMAMVQGYYGMPGNAAGHFDFQDAAALLSPGLALMMLPHVGRHLMQTRGRHRFLDAQFILLVLPGAALALLPLVPEMGWTTRYLPLWPACTILLVPTSTAACLMGLPGARRFLLGCLIPPLAVAASVMGLEHGYMPSLLASLPLWGTALSALLIAATAAPRQPQEDPIDLTMPALESVGDPVPADAPLSMGDDPLPLLDDPNLRLLPAEPEKGLPLPDMGMPTPRPAAAAVPPSGKTGPAGKDSAPGVTALQERLSQPLDDLLREAAALSACSLPPGARETAGNMTEAARRMAALLQGQSAGGSASVAAAASVEEDFNLQELMRSVHDGVAASAEQAGISLAWYMPPQLPSLFRGDHAALRRVLHQLLESAVRATRRGNVHVSVRPMPESLDPGHLLFTVRDSGSGLPPQQRSALALAHAWELAGRYEGLLRVEADAHGTIIAFSLHLPPVAEGGDGDAAPVRHPARPSSRTEPPADGMAMPVASVPQKAASAAVTAAAASMEAPAPQDEDDGPRPLQTPDLRQRTTRPRVMICIHNEMELHLFTQKINDLPYVIMQTRTLREALAMHERRPYAILILAGSHVSPDIAPALARFRQRAGEARLPVFAAIAVTEDDSQWDALAHAGFTHALLEPVERETLRETVQEILADVPITVRPAPSVAPAGDDGKAAVKAASSAPVAAPVPMDQPRTGAAAEPAAAPHTEDAAQDVPAAGAPQPEPRPEILAEAPLAHEAADMPLPVIEDASVTEPEVEIRQDDLPVTADAAAMPDPHEAQKVAITTARESHEVPQAAQARQDTRVALDNRWGEAPATPEASPAADAVEQAEVAEDTRQPLRNAWGETPATGEVEEMAPEATPEPATEAAPAPAEAAPVTAAANEAPSARADAPRQESVSRERPARPAPRIGSGLLPGAGNYDSHVEWVGEPTPIVRSADTPAAPSLPERRVNSAGAETLRRQIVDIVSRTSETPKNTSTEVRTMSLKDALKQEESRAVEEVVVPEPQPERGAPQNVARAVSVAVEKPASAPSPAAAPVTKSAASAGPADDRLPEGSAPAPAAEKAAPSLLRRVFGRLGSGGAPQPADGPAAMPEPDMRRPAPQAAPASAGMPAQPAAARDAASSPVTPARQTLAGNTGDPFPAERPGKAEGMTSAVDTEMLELAEHLAAAIHQAQHGYAVRDCRLVAEASQYIAQSAEAYGFRSLGRMARCVEQAGRHGDLDALRDLLPDLVAQVERSRITISREVS